MGHTGHGRPPAGSLPRSKRAAPVIGRWASTAPHGVDADGMTRLWALYRPGHTAEWWVRLRPDGAELVKTMNGTEFMSMRFRSGDDLMAFAAQERQEHLADGWSDVTDMSKG